MKNLYLEINKFVDNYKNELSLTECVYPDILFLCSYMSFCAESKEVKKYQAQKRSLFKQYLRQNNGSAKFNKLFTPDFLDKLQADSPNRQTFTNKYFQDCKNIFIKRYLYNQSIAQIITLSSNEYLCESEIHRRIDYVIDSILSEMLGEKYIFPGIKYAYECFLKISKM